MPHHIAFILRHAAFGFALSALFIGLLLAFDVVGLWHLVTHTAEGAIALLVMFVLCGITFGSAQVGYRIMTMGSDEGGPGGRRDDLRADNVLIPIRVERDPRHR